MAWPVMPTAVERVLAMMGLAQGPPEPEDLTWGRLQPGTVLPPVAPLFPRIEVPGAEPRAPKEKRVPEETTPPAAAAGPPAATTQAQAPAPALITIDEFAKLELRVALVKTAEKIAGSKKLLKLTVDLGDEVRQIVSGIADAYTPESLVGRKVVLVANLKPAKLMGVDSFGMVLAASLDGKAVLCTFDADVPPGTKVK
jgi:methionyl-tRNA synthetase